MSIESVMPSNHPILCHPILFLPFIFPIIRTFSSESTLCIRWSNYWSCSVSVSPFNEYSGLFSLGIDWFDILTVQGISRIFSNTTFRKHQFFHSQPSLWSNSHIHTWLKMYGKIIALTIWTFVDSDVCFLICCLGGRNFSWKEQVSFNLVAAVTNCRDFGAPQNKVSHCFHCFPIYLPWSDGTRS